MKDKDLCGVFRQKPHQLRNVYIGSFGIHKLCMLEEAIGTNAIEGSSIKTLEDYFERICEVKGENNE